MLPTNPYLTAPIVAPEGQNTAPDVPLSRRERGAIRFTSLRTLAATGVVIMTVLAAAGPSWAGPAGGC